MARQNIELGTAPAGTGGDTPRSAFTKINSMTTEIYARLAQLGNASNAVIAADKNGTAGQVVTVGDPFGIGRASEIGAGAIASSMNQWESAFRVIDATRTQYGSSAVQYGTLLNMAYPGGNTTNLGSQLWMGVSPAKVIGFRSGDYASTPFNIIYHTGNTTRAADGTLKAI